MSKIFIIGVIRINTTRFSNFSTQLVKYLPPDIINITADRLISMDLQKLRSFESESESYERIYADIDKLISKYVE